MENRTNTATQNNDTKQDAAWAAPAQKQWKRNAVFFITGQFLSLFGTMLVSHAVTWHITVHEQSGVLMALFTCAALLPMVFVSPFAGVWADRYNCKYLVNLADGMIAFITLIVALLYSNGVQSIWVLFITVIARSIGQGIQQPAVSALIPQMVPEEHLTRFNGVNGTIQSLTMFASPMAAAALLSWLPIEAVFYIDVVTAIIGISTVFFFVKTTNRTPKPVAGNGIKVYYNEMMEGLRFILEQSWLKILLLFTTLFSILAAPAAILTSLQVTRTFGGGYWRLNAIDLAFSIGMVGGGALISVWGGFRNKVHTMALAWFIFAVTVILFGIVPYFWIYVGVMGVCGIAMPLYNTPCMTLMQTKVPPQLMGRVFSVLMMINGLAMPLGMALFGPLADMVKIEALLIVTGVCMLFGAFTILINRNLVRSGLPEAPKIACDQDIDVESAS